MILEALRGTLKFSIPMEKDSGCKMGVDSFGKSSLSAIDILTEFSFEEAVGSQLSNIAADQKRTTKIASNSQNKATQAKRSLRRSCGDKIYYGSDATAGALLSERRLHRSGCGYGTGSHTK